MSNDRTGCVQLESEMNAAVRVRVLGERPVNNS